MVGTSAERVFKGPFTQQARNGTDLLKSATVLMETKKHWYFFTKLWYCITFLNLLVPFFWPVE